ncbi:CLUMA_CG008821, isoform A [Clunio marinus]|uniref:CLUMA_CG008821, isoform A n=1 Tax=Clunio marinus TaxID=568069 RepID=A0A1J1I665_9DIPT|nr:CLUMA_CG008821, isoform A [Clunio marinus]
MPDYVMSLRNIKVVFTTFLIAHFNLFKLRRYPKDVYELLKVENIYSVMLSIFPCKSRIILS